MPFSFGGGAASPSHFSRGKRVVERRKRILDSNQLSTIIENSRSTSSYHSTTFSSFLRGAQRLDVDYPSPPNHHHHHTHDIFTVTQSQRTMSPPPTSQAVELRRPQNAQTVSVNISEGSQNGNRRFQLEVSECVETKTVTTTTRLTRKFPHVFVRDPIPLENLDTKEYPLAMKPTPPELIQFSYTLPNGPEADDEHHGFSGKSVSWIAMSRSLTENTC